jgi:hypothetical protein
VSPSKSRHSVAKLMCCRLGGRLMGKFTNDQSHREWAIVYIVALPASQAGLGAFWQTKAMLQC